MITEETRILIIDTSGVPFWVRVRDVVLTVLVWFAYVFLIRIVPIWLVAQLADLLLWHGMQNFLEEYQPGAVDRRVVFTLAGYTAVVIVNAVILVIWAQYNLRRFGGLDRRRDATLVTPEDQGNFFGWSGTDVEAWQDARELTMRHDDGGRLVEVAVDQTRS